MKNSFKKQLWISIGVIGGTFVVVAIGLYLLVGDISTHVQKVIADRTIVTEQSVSLANLASLRHDEPQAARYEAAIQKLLPDQYALVNFGQWISSEGQKFNVVTHFSYRGDPILPSGSTAGSAAFGADAEGTDANLTAFMKDVESQAPGYLLNIETFNFQDSGGNGQVSIGGTLYFR